MTEAFQGRKLVVVGGSSGMGRQTAIDVVERGGSAVIIGQNQDKVDQTVKELSATGQAWGIAGDLRDRDQVRRVREQLAAEHADATLLVNSAGTFLPQPFFDHDDAAFDTYHDVTRAIFFITQTVARGMVDGGKGGSIVNVGSMWALQAIGLTPSSAYSMAKGGLHALTHNLALELAPHQIRVNAVAPGAVATPIFEKFLPKEQVPAALEGFLPLHPLGRVGTPKDMSAAITYLLSADASWVTGVILSVDGGVMAGR
ncbi:SDR family oxidoreductase [Actinoplanes sp. TBRC 11911]|uniref:SDR family NAD(P)-dependent oxidoreductase n=1 Tax=Actinoplanes sp. TBRC 11911 TaxID=2729386 RepID=UPI00145F593B|nr:SDR family oxidoreductase [Actinoplanes sp. TBRC 11911]NMO54617.1 SDR family oxidoreductase [Actinoplanes sp. TBRC 11911]